LSFALPASSRDDRVNVNWRLGVSAPFYAGIACGERNPKCLEGAKNQCDLSPGLAFLNLDDPLAANPDFVGQFLLVKGERGAAVADEGSDVNGGSDAHGLECPCQMSSFADSVAMSAFDDNKKVAFRRHPGMSAFGYTLHIQQCRRALKPITSAEPQPRH
jgi:hypothetical protein